MYDWWRTGANVSRLWQMSIETWTASAYVVAERGAMIGNAAIFPASLDMREMGRMAPEKFDAFARGIAGAARARDPIEAAALALEPVHRRATANARRLRRK